MYIPRIYQTTPLKIGELLQLDAKAAHHILQVLRLKKNDSLVVFNGEGGEFEATLSTSTKKEAVVKLERFISKSLESPLHIHLCQAICRNDKMDYIIQKAVELGVNKITPLMTKRSEIKLSADDRIEKRRQRWTDIAIRACEQCGRNEIPIIEPITSLTNWLLQYKTELGTSDEKTTYRFLLSPHKGKGLSSFSPPTSSCFLVGPESGFDTDEENLAIQTGCIPVQIGPRVLRTETAALATISVMQTLWGDFSF